MVGIISTIIMLLLAAVACASESLQSSTTPEDTPTPIAASTIPPTPTPQAQDAPTPTPAATPAQLPLTEMDVERAFPALSFGRMTDLAYPDDGSNRLFVTLQPGRIMVFPNESGAESAQTFLDIEDEVNDRGNEEGLLGLAFDPEFSTNGYFYIYYSASDPRRSVISRFSVSESDPNRGDPNSERIILEVDQPFSNHNGGQIKFGPDGFLYIALGDGGSRADPRGNGQNLSTLLGSILRIDVSTLDDAGTYSIPPDNPFAGRGGDVREEIWAYGLRNPWRFSFDRETGVMWSADVGQNEFEEVNIIEPGRNYGWNVMEGFNCFNPARNCDQQGLTLPLVEYSHRFGCSVTGGYVYGGSRLPSLYGAYVYGDFCSGNIWALKHDGSQIAEHMRILDSDLEISSFGEDQEGEMYILSFDNGIYRFTSR